MYVSQPLVPIVRGLVVAVSHLSWPADVRAVQCLLRLRDVDEPVAWEPGAGSFPVDRLVSCRTPASHDRSRHIPVRAYSRCMRSTLRLESGLEHDLLRVVDRSPETTWIVTQPVRLKWRQGRSQRSHVPDMLTTDARGGVTLWDARPQERMDERFHTAAEVAGTFARLAGWQYRCFSGLEEQQRLNLMWLHGYRLVRPWYPQRTAEILTGLAERRGTAQLGDLLGLDDGSGEVTSTVWHLVYTGRLALDETSPMLSTSRVSLVAGDHG